MEESRATDSGVVPGPQTQDEALSQTGAGRAVGRRQRRSQAESKAPVMDLVSVSEVLQSGTPAIYGADCGEGPNSGSGVRGDDSDSSEYAPEVLPTISFIAFLGTGKTAVTIGTDGESQIVLQVHPAYLEQIIELLRRRNNILQVEIS